MGGEGRRFEGCRGAGVRVAGLKVAGSRGAGVRGAEARGAGLRGAGVRGAGVEGCRFEGCRFEGSACYHCKQFVDSQPGGHRDRASLTLTAQDTEPAYVMLNMMIAYLQDKYYYNIL